jgi:UDP-glucose 4-epimerase
MKNILITGGAGSIGSALAEQLLQNEEAEKIVIFDNLSRNNYHFFLGSAFPNKHNFNYVCI